MSMSNHLPSFPHRLGQLGAASGVTAIRAGTLGAAFSETLTLNSASPSSGPSSGGQTVILSGSGFLTGLSVTFGGAQATVVRVLSSAKILVTTPAHTAGTVNVVVTNPNGQSATLVGGYTYNALP
jgi:hypothetical protein